jgi:FkbM family methyltransferase
MTIQPRYGNFPPLVSGLLATVMQDRATLTPGRYQSVLADYRLDLARFDMAERYFALRGLFEWRIAAIASIVLRPGDTVFEGGAQLGTETFNYAALVGKTGTVVSFEADARLATRLVGELTEAGLEQCHVQSKALGEAVGHAYFDTVPETAGNSGVGALAPNDDAASVDGRVQVEVGTLDATAAEFGAPRLVVMDIQGGEFGALRGGTTVLSEHRPFVVLEVESGSLELLGSSAQQVLDLLNSHDYTCWRLTRLGLARVDAAQPDELCDWFAVPNESASIVPQVKKAFVRGGLLPPSSRRSPLNALRRA